MKIGRNDPCPCGSGKKYKQCCLSKPQAAASPGTSGTGSFTPDAPVTLEAEEQMATAMESYNSEQGEAPPEDFQQMIDQLLEKGPLHARRAVMVNRSIPTFFLRENPAINLLRCFLEFIIRAGGSVPLLEPEKALTDPLFDSSPLLELMLQWPHLDTSLRDHLNSPIADKLIFWVLYISNNLGLSVVTGRSISPTDKGTAFLGKTDQLQQVYRACLKEVTDEFNWFYPPDIPEQFEVIQDIIGFTLLILSHRTRDLEDPIFDPAEIFSVVDTTLSLSGEMRTEGIRTKEIREAFIDYSFLYYGYLMGFVDVDLEDSSDTKGRQIYSYRTTELFRHLFQWQL